VAASRFVFKPIKVNGETILDATFATTTRRTRGSVRAESKWKHGTPPPAASCGVALTRPRRDVRPPRARQLPSCGARWPAACRYPRPHWQPAAPSMSATRACDRGAGRRAGAGARHVRHRRLEAVSR
jgi:hypothetical protein